MTRITIATVKSFIRKNQNKIWVCEKSSFDCMTDCVQYHKKPQFEAAQKAYNIHFNNLGIRGVWFVGGGGDSCNAYNKDGFIGFSVYNCCGSWIVAIPA